MSVFTLTFLRMTVVLTWEITQLNAGTENAHIKIFCTEIINMVVRSGRRHQYVLELTYPQSNDGYGSALHATLGIRIAKTKRTKRRGRMRSTRRRWRKMPALSPTVQIVSNPLSIYSFNSLPNRRGKMQQTMAPKKILMPYVWLLQSKWYTISTRLSMQKITN